MIIESLKFDGPKTKQAVLMLKGLGVIGKKCLVVTDQSNPNAAKSFRNLPKTTLLSQGNLNTYEVVNHEVVVLTQGTLKKLTESLSVPAGKEKVS